MGTDSLLVTENMAAAGVIVTVNPFNANAGLTLYNKGFRDTGVADDIWVIECDLHDASVQVRGVAAVNESLNNLDWCDGCHARSHLDSEGGREIGIFPFDSPGEQLESK